MSNSSTTHADTELDDGSKRDFIFLATGTTAAAGAAALGWPLVAQMGKAADTLAAGSIEIDLSKVAQGQQLKMLWRGKPVFVRHRTPAEIKIAEDADVSGFPDPQVDSERLIPDTNGNLRPEFLVMVGVCTHFGCVPVGEAGDFEGWYCPCHGSHYDTSGRIRKGPAPKNMEIPPYSFINENVIKVGIEIMSGPSTYEPKYAAAKWMDQRLPIIRMGADFMTFPSPRNLNYWYTFGGILALCLVVQILSGVILAMHYVADVDKAFASVQRIRRDVPFGWLLQSMHAVGASMFFLAVYMHMFRGLYYGSYKAPREVIWILGCAIYLVMMATAFLGYTLPWGQMSFWGATVITGFFGAVPVVGESLQQWLLGGYAVDNATLNRFFALHYLLPFVIAALVGLHVWALHHVGQNNPIGISEKTKEDTLSFHPFYTVKDAFAIAAFLVIFAIFLFYLPDALGHADNYIEADPLKTPAHIVPEWYFLPFYAILRAVPSKLFGILLMLGAIVVLFVLPWLDTHKVRSMRFRPIARGFFIIFIFFCFVLGWCGAGTPDDVAVKLGSKMVDGLKVDAGITFYRVSQIATIYYFAYFLLILPVLGLVEKPLKRPDSITKAVLGDGKHDTISASAT